MRRHSPSARLTHQRCGTALRCRSLQAVVLRGVMSPVTPRYRWRCSVSRSLHVERLENYGGWVLCESKRRRRRPGGMLALVRVRGKPSPKEDRFKLTYIKNLFKERSIVMRSAHSQASITLTSIGQASCEFAAHGSPPELGRFQDR
jgi:hypothetical protein